MNMTGKAALITGAASGIGEGIARLFAQQGANVYLLDKDQQELQRVVRELKNGGGSAFACIADLCHTPAVEREIARIHAGIGTLDVLVNNAGAYPRRAFLEMTEEEWREIMDVNLNSAYRCARLVIPRMVERRAGKVINISSVTFYSGLKNLTHYISAKGAIIGFTRALARELGEFNVHVNCITPGAVLTDKESKFATPEQAASIVQLQSLQRRILPLDIARVCVFLATEWSDGLTGQTINVDGGWVMH